MDDIQHPDSSEPADMPLCPVCGEPRLECDRPDCAVPPHLAEAALCQHCGKEHSACELRLAEKLRKASLDTPFKIGI